ncbi:hypothetical protein B0H10DRAFT_2026164 [Mycena sp. CBHHK59/15]|nr:hypothetical protein B0H10DRAFT_2026164 [Mycena sp. CBHHK59/15]
MSRSGDARSDRPRQRTSFLGHAGDAIATRFGRRRPSLRQPPDPPLILSQVIDISVKPLDEDLEERQRLRDAAAHSIGLGPLLDNDDDLQVDPDDIDDDRPPPSPSPLSPAAGPAPDDRELERLEINAASLVFVADDDVPGRPHVVKVAGTDVGALRRDWNTQDDAGRAVWLLHLPSPADAQRWISAIKNAILEQRTIRAGLAGPTAPLTGTEPRGDMDVMLSMRAQGLITSPSSYYTPAPASPTYASSTSSRSVRSVATAPIKHPSSSSASGAVSALKGLFSPAARPRSASAASSMSDSDRDDAAAASFTRMGSLLAGSLHSNTTSAYHPAIAASPPHAPVPHKPILPVGGGLERRIVGQTERERGYTIAGSVMTNGHANGYASSENGHATANGHVDGRAESLGRSQRALSVGTHSLQPPPRSKRWTASASAVGEERETTSLRDGSLRDGASIRDNASVSFRDGASLRDGAGSPMYSHAHANESAGTAGSFGVQSMHDRRASTLRRCTPRAALRARRASRASSSPGTAGTGKRWSRQSATLPRRLTPPNEPPPAAPAPRTPHPYAAQTERPSSRTSAFSKRPHGLLVVVRAHLAHRRHPRTSVPPPPRPAPTAALPPAPSSAPPAADAVFAVTVPPRKSSFRDSVTHRALRLSLMAPKPPPSAVLPPRPGEATHVRSNSSGSAGPGHVRQMSALGLNGLGLYSIPASPLPPPRGPLPPTPAAPQPQPQPVVTRHTSLKQRLRILSAPPVPHNNSGSFNGTERPRSRPMTLSSFLSTSTPSTPTALHHPALAPAAPTPPHTPPPPHTPIGEKIIEFHTQNDPSFLQLAGPPSASGPSTPVLRALPPLDPAPAPVSEYAELAPLSPPPRRGSRQISIKEAPEPERAPSPEPEPRVELQHDREAEGAGPGPGKLFSLSRHGSVISLGIVTM